MRVDSWCKISKDEISELKRHMLEDKLTVVNPEYAKNEQMGFSNRGVKRHQKVYKEIGNELWIPRALAHSVSRDYEDRREEGVPIDFKSQIKLGPNDIRQEDQESFVNDILTGLEGSMGCVGQAEPGFGKTVASLEVVARLGRKTAVVVHKTFLLDQWKERILEFYDIEPSDIGIVHAGNDRSDWEDKKIVIMLCQSLLSTREYPKAMYESFGTIVFDEVHRFAANEFRKTIVKFPAKYRLGVTATPERRDGMEDVFFWHIGEIAAKGSKRKIKPRIAMVDTKIPITRLQKRNLSKNGSIGWSTMITYLTERDDRNRKIAKQLFKALKAGRKILALSDRRDHLRALARLVKIMMKKYDERFTIGFYVGGTDRMERTIAAGRDLVFGTYQMAEEGLDIPALDTLFLMTPRSAVEQAVGRILRQHDNKKEPLVVDFVDTDFHLAQGVARKREKRYRELGYM